MALSKTEQSTTIDTIFISDDALKQTYTSRHSAQYKTNLLGIEEGCHKKFKLIPVIGSIYSDKPDNIQPLVSDVQQGNLGNCAFLAMLRAIVRRHPHLISTIIRDLDEQYVEVKLFSTQENEVKLIQYKLEKTIIVPAPSITNQFIVTTLGFFASKLANKNEKNWVKLIEKAFVIHSMNTGYSHHLMNLQNHELKGKYPSYEDVVSCGQENVCKALLGCTVETVFLFGRCDNESKNKLKAELFNGELITVSFEQNQFGIETKHAYELVNIGQSKQDEFVILSNPWGFNQTVKFKGITIPNILSLDMIVKYPPNEISDDQSIIIIPMEIFKKIAWKCVMTSGINMHNLIENNPVNSATLS